MTRWMALLLVMLAARPTLAAMTTEQRQAILEEALAAYDQGMAIHRSEPARAERSFRESADRLQQLIDDGVDSAAVHYDLGNAWARLGTWGRAILHYRKAQLRAPGDDRVAQNLAFARSQRRDQLEITGRRALLDAVLSWHRDVSLGTRIWIFSIAYLAFWALVIGRVLRGWSIRWPAIVLAAVATAYGASLCADLVLPSGTSEGVLLRDDVTVRKGNGAGYEAQFREPLHQGVEFRVLEERADWTHIELPDGGRGWVRSEQVGLIE